MKEHVKCFNSLVVSFTSYIDFSLTIHFTLLSFGKFSRSVCYSCQPSNLTFSFILNLQLSSNWGNMSNNLYRKSLSFLDPKIQIHFHFVFLSCFLSFWTDWTEGQCSSVHLFIFSLHKLQTQVHYPYELTSLYNIYMYSIYCICIYKQNIRTVWTDNK